MITDLSEMKSEGFNFMRLPLSWDVLQNEGVKNFQGNLTNIRNEADAENIQVVYDAHTSGNGAEPGEFLPSGLTRASSCPSSNTILTCWWENETTYGSMNGWQTVWQDFWVPVLNTVDSYNSTFGYEMANEPVLGNATLSNLKSYYHFIASNMLNYGTPRRIVFMAPFSGLSESSVETVYPRGVANLINDAHCYPNSGCGSTHWSQANSTLQSLVRTQTWLQNNAATGARIWIGEWNVCNSAFSHTQCDSFTESQMDANITVMVNALEHADFASTYWAWRYDTFNVPLLLNTSGQTYWLTNDLGSYENGMMIE